MIVEFIGSTGAGKTTLISEVQKSLARRVAVTTSYDLVATPLGLSGMTHPTGRNLVKEFVGLPFLIRSLPRHKAFILFTLRMLARQADLSIFTINNLRSLVRKLGVYEIGRRREQHHIVLVDEGTILTAHNVFVYSSARYTAGEIDRFANLVPLPDIIVYVRAPVDSMVERSLRRSDPPRELRSKNRVLIEKYITRATAMFDQLVKAENIQSRTLTVENPDSAGKGYEATADRITDCLLGRYTSHQDDSLNGAISQADNSLERTRHVT